MEMLKCFLATLVIGTAVLGQPVPKLSPEAQAQLEAFKSLLEAEEEGGAAPPALANPAKPPPKAPKGQAGLAKKPKPGKGGKKPMATAEPPPPPVTTGEVLNLQTTQALPGDTNTTPTPGQGHGGNKPKAKTELPPPQVTGGTTGDVDQTPQTMSGDTNTTPTPDQLKAITPPEKIPVTIPLLLPSSSAAPTIGTESQTLDQLFQEMMKQLQTGDEITLTVDLGDNFKVEANSKDQVPAPGPAKIEKVP